MESELDMFIRLYDEELSKLLAAKPAWGKNELLLLHEKAKTAALLRMR